MLSGLEARGIDLGDARADEARARVAQALREMLPDMRMTIEDEAVVLTGRIDLEDERLRWIAGALT